MRTTTLPFLPLGLLAVFLFSCSEKRPSETPLKSSGMFPSDDYYLQRNYPDGVFSVKALESALKQAHIAAATKSDGFDAEWTVQGPGNIGARINTVAVNPVDENTLYAGFAQGGVWKTTDGGQQWHPIFDERQWLSIGDIALDPGNPDVVYIGTGDPNITGFPWIGDGLWRSPDGGQNWEHLGLAETRIISRVVVHPTNSNILYVAAMGLPFERNLDRGVYRSTNGGQNWSRVLLISNQAGVTDLEMDPFDPNTLYAAGWDRIRNNQESLISGPGARIFKTTDGGTTWLPLAGGLPSGNQGRIALTLSRQTPGLLYARYVGTNSSLQGIYRSADAGQTWAAVTTTGAEDALAGFGWYFGNFEVNPAADDHLFLLGVDLWELKPGTNTWTMVGPPWWEYNIHADKHDLVFSPSGNSYLATDGGLYKSPDIGANWEDIENIPTTQFYRVAYNPHNPDYYYGGAQDNGTTGGNALFINEWERIFGGDGFQPVFHPDEPDVFYVETQNGNISVTTNGGFDFSPADDGIDGSDRRSWDMPYLLSQHDSSTMYAGTFRLYKSENPVIPFFQPISADLTDGIVLHPRYHNITEISESPLQPGLLYVGTADGNIWRTDDDGQTWILLSTTLPDRFVSDVVASPSENDWVYASHSGYKDNEFIPRIFRSKDRGQTWESTSGDLPDLAINELLVLPGHADSILFAANDGGVYATLDAGQHWKRLGTNLPFVPVYDLTHNPVHRQLVAGTHARSIMTYPLDSLLQEPDTATAVNQHPLEKALPLQIYPNPARAHTTVSFAGAMLPKATILITGTDGRQHKTILTPERRGNGWLIPIDDLPTGLYVVMLRSGRVTAAGKLLVQ